MKQLQGLIAFVEVAAAGSIAAAAVRLDVTPAAVSKNLLRLEAQLGVRLIQRSTRRMRLTDEGERFLDKARLALRGIDEAVADVSQSAATPAGRVRLSIGVSFGRRWVLSALPAISRQHEGLTIEIDLDNHEVDLVAQGYDIGIRGGAVKDSSLIARRLCGLPLVLVASPGYLKRYGVPQSIDELALHRAVQMRFVDGGFSTWRFRVADKGGARKRLRQFQPEAPIVVNDGEALADLALADAGIAQVGLYIALPYLRSGRLKLVLPALHDAGDREFVLHYPHRQYLAPRVRVVVDALLAHFAHTPDLHLKPEDLPREHHAAPSKPPRSRA